MNKKEQIIEDVLAIVLDECGYSFRTISKEDIISKRGDLVLQMTRCIFVTQLVHLNYSKPIIAAYLNRTEQAIEISSARPMSTRTSAGIGPIF